MSAPPERDRSATASGASGRRHVEHDMLLALLPQPIFVLASTIRTSIAMLKRQKLAEVMVFGSPLTALVEQVRHSGATLNEYGLEIALPKPGAARLVDVFAGGLPEQPGAILVMLQQRSMRKGACRSTGESMARRKLF